MERELVGLLGAGLTSAATGYGVAVPVGAIDRGYTLVDVLSRECGPRIGTTLNSMVQALWLEWQRTGLGRETTALHAGALPAIIELNRPRPEAFAVARNTSECGRLLAADVLERARQSGDILRAGLDEGIAYALLERLYQAIFAEQTVLPEMMAAVDLYLQTDLWRRDLAEPAKAEAQSHEVQPASPAPPAPPLPPPVHVPPLTPRATAAIRASIVACARKIADPEALATELGGRLAILIERVTRLAERAPDATHHLTGAAQRMADGEFAAAEHCLVAAQEAFIQRASSDLSLARELMHHAAALLTFRAEFEEIRIDLRKAARHYRAATRCLTAADGELMLQLLDLQAQALQRLDRMDRDDAALTEAARALAEAMALDPNQISGASAAQSRMRLAEIHFDLGRRSANAEHYLAAARWAGEALSRLDPAADVSASANTGFVRAEALWFAADITGDIGIMDAAAEALRGALAYFPRERAPQRWVELSSLLGQSLLRLASARAEPRLLPPAIEHLRAAVQFASTCNVEIDTIPTEAALGRALLAEYAAGGQPLLLDLAATAFRRAIKAAAAAGKAEAQGAMQHELGMTLWAMAERANQTGGLAAAIEALEASIATFERIKDAIRAAVVRTDLGKLMATVAAASGRT